MTSSNPADRNEDAVRLIIGFSPRSASDTMASALAPELEKALDRPVVLDRHMGEDGVVAARALMDAPPDGRHLLIVTLGTHALNPAVAAVPPYDPVADFTPVALLMRTPLVLGVAPTLPVSSVAELVALGRSRRLAFGCSAAIGAPRLAAELFGRDAGLDLHAAVYARTEDLYADLAAGRIDASFNNPMTMLPLFREGRARGIATTGPARLPAAPSLPTMAECGFADFAVENWVGIVGPKGLPPARAQALSEAIRAALGTPSMARTFGRLGLDASSSAGAAEFAAYLRDQVARWAPVAPVLRAA
ncbi:tripartite tricarboxylate transporter substrate binding protein [Pigmentiphaga soli]|uniref:Tripartite tricarboxylate transporter substrate binding protein n=1 Tax=Pigmentiphaga soli TaxID=1007095 RepID=A0ABP8GKX5_9BURK